MSQQTSSQKLSGKIALVTGGNSGIGLATAKRFASEGAHVFITGRRQDALDAAIKEIGAEHVTAVQGDVASLADLDRLFAKIKTDKGRLDVVFANAGIAEFAPIGEITEEHYDRIFNINVKGLLFTVQKALPLLDKGGSVILNASIVGVKGFPNMSVYSATKAAVRNFARGWSVDLKGRGIRVNVISPGPILTPGMTKLNESEEKQKAFEEQLAAGSPLGRIGDPDEIAKAAVFLATDDSSYITGVDLFVDGGFAQV